MDTDTTPPSNPICPSWVYIVLALGLWITSIPFGIALFQGNDLKFADGTDLSVPGTAALLVFFLGTVAIVFIALGYMIYYLLVLPSRMIRRRFGMGSTEGDGGVRRATVMDVGRDSIELFVLPNGAVAARER